MSTWSSSLCTTVKKLINEIQMVCHFFPCSFIKSPSGSTIVNYGFIWVMCHVWRVITVFPCSEKTNLCRICCRELFILYIHNIHNAGISWLVCSHLYRTSCSFSPRKKCTKIRIHQLCYVITTERGYWTCWEYVLWGGETVAKGSCTHSCLLLYTWFFYSYQLTLCGKKNVHSYYFFATGIWSTVDTPLVPSMFTCVGQV